MLLLKKQFFNKPIVLSLSAGFLLFAAWPMSPLTFLIFFAFIPLLHLSNLKISNAKYFGCLYLAMLLWNVCTTWWIWFASPPGAVAAFIANSLLMCIPWLLYRMVKKRLSTFLSYVALICFWMLWEYTHLQDWGLSWPWLTVGNVFATSTNFIQWYEFTGVSGGTFLVFLVNVFLFDFFIFTNKFFLLKNYVKKLSLIKIILHTIYSLLIFSSIFFLFFFKINFNFKLFDGFFNNNIKSILPNIVIVQPNIDPYEKVSSGSYEAQLKTLINTSKQQVDSNTVLLIWPETALYNEYRFDENNLNCDKKLDSLFAFLKLYPKLQLFTGIESYKTFAEPTVSSRAYPNTNFHYESFNSSVLLDKDGAKQFYHKSMLVPGVETLPSFLSFMGKWFEDFGGTTNGYVKQKKRTPIVTNTFLRIAPAICYESIYGEFMSKYIKNEANIISIITNDGWWRNTPGHMQHNAYASLRAIENHCWVARSANTGISSVISPTGEVKDYLAFNTNGAIKMEYPNLKPSKTFYTQYPDLLYKIAIVLSVLLMLLYNIKIWK